MSIKMINSKLVKRKNRELSSNWIKKLHRKPKQMLKTTTTMVQMLKNLI